MTYCVKRDVKLYSILLQTETLTYNPRQKPPKKIPHTIPSRLMHDLRCKMQLCDTDKMHEWQEQMILNITAG